MKSYEIFCRSFSQIIYAKTLIEACCKFSFKHPDEEIIFAEDVKCREEDIKTDYVLIELFENL